MFSVAPSECFVMPPETKTLAKDIDQLLNSCQAALILLPTNVQLSHSRTIKGNSGRDSNGLDADGLSWDGRTLVTLSKQY